MSDLEAANRALILLGVEPVTSLAENIKAARIMLALLQHCKRVVLSEFPWPFAMNTVALSQVAPGRFSYPAGALNVYRVVDMRGDPVPFEVEWNQIHADVAGGFVKYTMCLSNLEHWAPQVVECFITRLASDAANSLTGTPQLAMSLLEKYGLLVRLAIQTAAVEKNEKPLENTDYVDAR